MSLVGAHLLLGTMVAQLAAELWPGQGWLALWCIHTYDSQPAR